MRYLPTLMTTQAAIIPLISAHNLPPLPHTNSLTPRHENTTGRCGEQFGSCAENYCCNGEGRCGNTYEYCYSGDCQYHFGPACPENDTPTGSNTTTIPRPKLSALPYGGLGLTHCTRPNTIALTYDDGPQVNTTDHILSLLEAYNAKATFFVLGNSIAQIDTSPAFSATIRRAHARGHQIAAHTWTHRNLSTLPDVDIQDQMVKTEMALRNILGVIPTFARPPFASCAEGCRRVMEELGYHIVYYDVDTKDYEYAVPDKIQVAKDGFKTALEAGKGENATRAWLTLSHDIHFQTAYNLTEFMLQTAMASGLKAVTVGECLGDPVENWYREAVD